MKLPLIPVHIMLTDTLAAKLKEASGDAAKKGYKAGRHAEATIANHEISKLLAENYRLTGIKKTNG